MADNPTNLPEDNTAPKKGGFASRVRKALGNAGVAASAFSASAAKDAGIVAVAGAAAAMSSDTADAKQPEERSQGIKIFRMPVVAPQWDHLDKTIDSITLDPVPDQFLPRPAVGQVVTARFNIPPPGHGYNVDNLKILNASTTFRSLPPRDQKEVAERYNTRHIYSKSHAKYDEEQMIAMLGSSSYPILEERSFGKPFKTKTVPDGVDANGKPKTKKITARDADGNYIYDMDKPDELLGYVYKLCGNDLSNDEAGRLPCIGTGKNKADFKIEGKLVPIIDSKNIMIGKNLVVTVTLEETGMDLSMFNMAGCRLRYTRPKDSAGKKIAINGKIQALQEREFFDIVCTSDTMRSMLGHLIAKSGAATPEQAANFGYISAPGDQVEITVPHEILMRRVIKKQQEAKAGQPKPIGFNEEMGFNHVDKLLSRNEPPATGREI